MGIFKNIFGNKRNSEIFTNEELVNGGACPNCWGSQEYDNSVRELIAEKQVDVDNHASKHAFIQDFVINNVDVIKIRKGDNGLECPNCKVSY